MVLSTPERMRLRDLAAGAWMTWREMGDAPPALPDGVKVWTMDQAGIVSERWEWSESVRWHEATAWRAETPFGNPVTEDDPFDDWGDY